MKKLSKKILFLFSTILIFLPLFYYGLTDIEEYNLGFFTSNYYYNRSSLLATFIDFIGPGINLPLGQGLFFFPTNLFNFDFKIFYIVTIIFCLYLQFNYFNKCSKLIFKFKSYSLSILFLFSLTNFSYLYFTDWLSCFVTYSLITPIIYYSIKFNVKKNENELLKLILFFSILILNGHLGFAIFAVYLILIFFLLNSNFFFFKKKYFYIVVIFFFIIILEKLYTIISLYFNSSDIAFGIHNGYQLKDYFYGLIKPFITFFKILEILFNHKFLDNVKPLNGREAIYGAIFIISFIVSIFILIKKESKNIFYFNIIYLIFFISTFFNHSWIPLSSGAWQGRDVLNILSFFLFIYFLKKNKKRKIIYNFCIILTIFTNSLLWLESANFVKKNNFISLNYFNKTNKNVFLENFNNKKTFKKLYISPEVFKLIDNKSSKSNFFIKNYIFSSIDLYKYNIYPFNLKIKNQEVPSLRKSKLKMYTYIEPRYDEINNQRFLNLYKIENILIFKKELKKLDDKLFFIKDEILINNGTLVLLELKQKKSLILKNDYTKIFFKICPKREKIKCILSSNQIVEINNINFKKISNNKFEIKNNNKFTVNYILPFSDISKFLNGNKFIKISDSLVAVKISPKDSVEVNIENKTSKYMRILSIIIFFVILLFIINNKLSNTRKLNIQ